MITLSETKNGKPCFFRIANPRPPPRRNKRGKSPRPTPRGERRTDEKQKMPRQSRSDKGGRKIHRKMNILCNSAIFPPNRAIVSTSLCELRSNSLVLPFRFAQNKHFAQFGILQKKYSRPCSELYAAISAAIKDKTLKPQALQSSINFYITKRITKRNFTRERSRYALHSPDKCKTTEHFQG